jgi:hypothetical protein
MLKVRRRFGQAVSVCAQSARWAVQFVAGTLGKAFAV